jgi:hypothetical protein
VKITAKITVRTRPIKASFLDPATIAWCAQVTVAPELKRKNVLVKGIPEV